MRAPINGVSKQSNVWLAILKKLIRTNIIQHKTMKNIYGVRWSAKASIDFDVRKIEKMNYSQLHFWIQVLVLFILSVVDKILYSITLTYTQFKWIVVRWSWHSHYYTRAIHIFSKVFENGKKVCGFEPHNKKESRQTIENHVILSKFLSKTVWIWMKIIFCAIFAQQRKLNYLAGIKSCMDVVTSKKIHFH